MTIDKLNILRIRVKNRLADLQQTQTWLAEQMGLSNNAISKWLKGDSDPKFSNLAQLARHLQCSVGYLVGDVEDDLTAEAIRLMQSADNTTKAKIVAGIVFMIGSTESESRTIKKAASFQ